MSCPRSYCSGDMSFVPAFPGACDEPAHDAFYECDSCGAVSEDDYDEGSHADYLIECAKGA